MKKVRLSDLSEPVRAFLNQIKPDESIMVEDDNGELRCGITPYTKATPAEKRRARASLENLWKHTEQAMRESGVTEADIDRDLQADD